MPRRRREEDELARVRARQHRVRPLRGAVPAPPSTGGNLAAPAIDAVEQAPGASRRHRAREGQRSDPRPGARIERDDERGSAGQRARLAADPPIASAPTGSPSTAKKPPFTPAAAPMRRAMALGRSRPATRSFESTPSTRPASDSRSIASTFTRQGPPSRTIEVQRRPGRTVTVVRRSSSERAPSGSSAAYASSGAARHDQGEQDRNPAAHSPQGGRTPTRAAQLSATRAAHAHDRRPADPCADLDEHPLRHVRVVDPPERERGQAARQGLRRRLDLLGRYSRAGLLGDEGGQHLAGAP